MVTNFFQSGTLLTDYDIYRAKKPIDIDYIDLNKEDLTIVAVSTFVSVFRCIFTLMIAVYCCVLLFIIILYSKVIPDSMKFRLSGFLSIQLASVKDLTQLNELLAEKVKKTYQKMHSAFEWIAWAFKFRAVLYFLPAK